MTKINNNYVMIRPQSAQVHGRCIAKLVHSAHALHFPINRVSYNIDIASVAIILFVEVNLSKKWPHYSTHDNSCILSVGPTTML